MALRLDTEFEAAVAPFLAKIPPILKYDPDNIQARRKIGWELSAIFKDIRPLPSDVEITPFTVPGGDGYSIPVFRFLKEGTGTDSAPAILHIHGGGMVTGDVLSGKSGLAEQVAQTGVQIFSVDYRLAPENRHPVPVEDCYAALTWLQNNTDKLGIDPKRIAVMGESAGGGIAAGVALLARDRGLSPPLAKQILIYPMLDDRNIMPNPQLEKFAPWKAADNKAGWKALLGDQFGTDDVSPYAAPARATSLANLPATYLDTGGLDLFRDEDIMYAARLAQVDVPTEFHLYPGVPHGFEGVSQTISVTKRALENRRQAILGF